MKASRVRRAGVLRRPLLPAGVAIVFAAGPAAAQESRPYERFAGFATFFEPETAALLGLSAETGRVSDFAEEGLAARARGYQRLRSAAAGPLLFPNAPDELDAALDPHRFLDRRVAEFHRVRAWARSPLYYVRGVAEALAAVEIDPGLDGPERRRALTERARQAPYVLDAAAAALVNPPRLLARQALFEGRILDRWIGALAARTAQIPEGRQKWALAQALDAAAAALRAFLDRLEEDAPSRSNGAPGLGEEVLSEIARNYGFDGAYHLVETLEAAVAEMRAGGGRATGDAAARLASPLRPDADVSLGRAVAARWPGSDPAPAVAASFGPGIAGRGPVVAAWRPGSARSSGGLARIYVAEDGAADQLVEAALAEAAAPAWLFSAADSPAEAATGGGDRRDPRAAVRLIVAWDGLAPAARWLAMATVSRASGETGGGAGAALAEAEAARLAALVHLGRIGPRDALERLATTGAPSRDASRLLAGHLSDPTGIAAPALGLLLFRLWRERGAPPPASLFTEWLGWGADAGRR